MSKIRRMILELDELDYNAVQGEIAAYQARSKAICPDEPTMVPDGDSNLAGAIVAESIRSLNEYRDLQKSK